MRLGFFILLFISLPGCKNDAVSIAVDDVALTGTGTADSSDVVVTDTLVQTGSDSVLFIFTYTNTWCNGSYPSDEATEELKKPHRLYLTPLLLKDERGHTFHLITDKKGRTKALIPAGHYNLLFDHADGYRKSPVGMSCDLYFDRSWGEIEIRDDQKEVKFNIELPCDLCDPAMKKKP